MKGLFITAIASFFALTVSAQTTTGTKATLGNEPANKVSTGARVKGEARPAKVATATSPAATVMPSSESTKPNRKTNPDGSVPVRSQMETSPEFQAVPASNTAPKN